MSELQVEASGETVGEAKWVALRELERLHPGLDRSAVRFQVVAEGERGLLGIGYAPARVIAAVDPGPAAAPAPPPSGLSPDATRVHELLERIVAEIGLRCRIEIEEDGETIAAFCEGDELGLLIGRRGQTIEAVQQLVAAIVFHGRDDRRALVVDAGGYRGRRRATVEELALRAAERAESSGEPVELDPMPASERRLVHELLKERAGVDTRSEGSEPSRYVVVVPAGG